MKVRQGFVSNSSSSSFIIRWKYTDKSWYEDEKNPLNFALHCLLDIYSWNHEKGQFDWDNCENGEREVVEEIVKNTKEISEGEFETSFFTIMRNSITDYGNACPVLCLALLANKLKFEIIETKEVGENYEFE